MIKSPGSGRARSGRWHRGVVIEDGDFLVALKGPLEPVTLL